MQVDELEKLIKTRRSIRAWKKKEVPVNLIKKALDIATYAPNGGNHQSWKFYVITSKDKILDIAALTQNKTDLIASWPEANEYGSSVEKWKKTSSFFKNAPCIIAACVGKYSSIADKILRARKDVDGEAKKIFEAREIAASRIQSVAAAISYMLLVFHQMGLGAVWMTGPVQSKEEIEKLLNIPDELDLIALVAVGYPDETPKEKEVKPLEEVIEFV
jgi:nitroreductase